MEALLKTWPLYGQAVFGPPGSGKTTYCKAAKRYLRSIDRRAILVNVDPGNEHTADEYDVDVRRFVDLYTIMQETKLGPNGAMVHAMEKVEASLSQLVDNVQELIKDSHLPNYVLFDFPGQVELYTHYRTAANVLQRFEELLNCRLCIVHVVDSQHCIQPTRFVSVLLLSLNAMLRLARPHVNVLSKFDLMKRHQDLLPFEISYYEDVMDLSYLLQHMPDTLFSRKYEALTKAISEIVEDFGLVYFCTLESGDASSIAKLLAHVDKAIGYVSKKPAGTTS